MKAPGNWWVVKPTPVVPSESEDLDHENEDQDEEENEEFAGAAHDLDPRSLKQALARSDGHKWQEAAKLKMESHKLNGHGNSSICHLVLKP